MQNELKIVVYCTTVRQAQLYRCIKTDGQFSRGSSYVRKHFQLQLMSLILFLAVRDVYTNSVYTSGQRVKANTVNKWEWCNVQGFYRDACYI